MLLLGEDCDEFLRKRGEQVGEDVVHLWSNHSARERISTFIIQIFSLIAIYAFSVTAAKAPLTPEPLRKQARHVVSGIVIKVTSQTRKSIIEKGPGIHRDRIFKIQLMVSAVSKGENVKPGD